MSYEQLLEHVRSFYGDTSRSQEETRDRLEDLLDEVKLLIDSLE